MSHRMLQRALVLGIVGTTLPGAALGQTIIINPRPIEPIVPPRPAPPRRVMPMRNAQLEVRKHAVTVSIVDGVATTALDQVFFNPHDRTVEGTYIFPLDDDVALGQFSMFVNGEEVEGKLLSVEEARRQYESIVARMRDPALLEYLGTRMFRARIFPINPKTDVRIKLSYSQMLKSDDGLVRYRYPFGIDKHSASPIDDASVLVSIESKTAIKTIFSPTHQVAVNRKSDHSASVSYEGKQVIPDKNFELFYTLSDKAFGLTVLTYQESGQDGFFVARISPPTELDGADVLPKDISFVIDTSGSMAGEKMQQARDALEFCLSSLNSEDRFNVIPFSHEATSFKPQLVSASAENIEAARQFSRQLKASGGTNINDAILTALKAAGAAENNRPHLIVFLTDGQPTVGVVNTNEILSNISGANADRNRLYVFGVGYDVNTHLLDLLAEQNRGARDYVEPGENLELKLSSFYRKVAEPVLADVALSFGDLEVYDLFPTRLGDLFAGSELVVAGRYQGAGPKAVTLTGTRRGTKQRFVYETTFSSEAEEHAFLPSLWATRKVGYLLDQIRLHGENTELKQSIVELATRYGIVTPYTAYLVTEPGGLAQRGGRRDNILAESVRERGIFANIKSSLPTTVADGRQGAAAMEPLSKKARRAHVSASRRARRLSTVGDTASAGVPIDLMEGVGRDMDDGSGTVRRVGARTFYRIGERWVDSDYDGSDETTKVELFSPEYFSLLRKHPDLAKCFALGERVVVVINGDLIETIKPSSR